jgi:hypothetical protein
MTMSSSRTRSSRPLPDRVGSALILVLVMTAGLAALAMSAIFMASSSGLMTRYYDRERNYRYAAEQALQIGVSRLAKDTSIHLADTGYMQLMSSASLTDANGVTIPNTIVNLYVGLTGNTTGQFGQFASLIAEVNDASGNTKYFRRLELMAQNFARYTYFTNTFPTTVCLGNNEFVKGLAFSNQGWYSCAAATYYDTVSAAGTVSGGSPTFMLGYRQNVAPIAFPTVTRLASLPGYASAANYSFTPNTKGALRIEFKAINLNPTVDTDSSEANEGFFRVFQDTSSYITAAAYYDLSTMPADSIVYNYQCGDWHTINGMIEFFPWAVHRQAWFHTLMTAAAPAGGGLNAAQFTADTVSGSTHGRPAVMSHATPRQARCYPSGDPHLVAVERSTASGTYHVADTTKGGYDTTFTPVTRRGYWMQWPGAVPAPLAALTTRTAAELPYLFPLYRGYNANTKGVIYVNGSVYLSGMLNGFVTLYASHDVYFTDELTYVTDPATVLCANLFGVIAADSVMIADNAINSPQNPTTPTNPNVTSPTSMWMSDNQSFNLDGVTMALAGTVGVENYGAGAYNMTTCDGNPIGRGCINQIGGVIEQSLSGDWTTQVVGGVTENTGFMQNRGVDECLYQESPPYFPLTGKYTSNRFFETDPKDFNISTIFHRLQAL